MRLLLGAAWGGRDRDWLMLLVAFRHGLRVGEVTQITRDSIQGEYLHVERLKGSRATTQRLISAEEGLLDERTGLLDYVRGFAGNQRLFPVSERHANRLILRYGEIAGLPAHKCHMHTLKHSCAKYLQSLGVPLPVIQAWLGHVSLGSTGIYLVPTDEEVSSTVQRAALGLLIALAT